MSYDPPVLMPVDASLHPTYGDDFDGDTLDPKWTRRNFSATQDKMYRAYGGSWAMFDWSTVGANLPSIRQAAPAGDFTLQARISVEQPSKMVGLFILNSVGTGVACSIYHANAALYMWNVTTWAYASTGPTLATPVGYPGIVNLELRKVGTAYDARFTHDGLTWTSRTSTITNAFTPAFIGIGSFINPPGPQYVLFDRFTVY